MSPRPVVSTFPVTYGRTLFIRGLPKERCNKWKWKLLTEEFQRYGQLDNVFVPADKAFGFVTFFKASALRFVLGSSSSIYMKVKGFQLECSKAYCLQEVSESKKDNEKAWWKQVPINVDYTKSPVKKKKCRHRNTEFGMTMEPGATKKMKKTLSKKRSKKDKKKKRMFFCPTIVKEPVIDVTKFLGPKSTDTSQKNSIMYENGNSTPSSNKDEVGQDTTAKNESLLAKKEEERCAVFIRLPNGFVVPYEAHLYMSMQDQMKDVENICGPLPIDAYLTHDDKLLEISKPLRTQGVNAGANIDVKIRLKGGAPESTESELKLQKKIKELDKLEDPNDLQGEIRLLYWEIDDLENVRLKKDYCHQLSRIARKAFEKDLTKLLRNNCLLDTALDLVLDCIRTINDLAKKLYKSSSDGKNDNKSFILLKEKLGSKLETRGALVCEDINAEELAWAATLIKKCPTLRRLQTMKFSELSCVLQPADSHDRLCVENIYSEGSDIRKQCRSYGLSLETSQILEEKGITNVSDMTDSQLGEALEEMPANQRSRMKKMHSNTNKGKLKEKEEEQERLESYKKRLEEAKSLVHETRKDAGELFEKSKERFENRMKEIAAKVKLPADWNVQNVDDPHKLLDHVEQVLNITAAKLDISPYDTNEEIVAAASGGLSRYGISIVGDDAGDVSKRPPFPILKKPEYVEWLSPSRTYEVSFFKTTQTNATTLFYKSVESSGLSIATSISGGYAGFYAKASAHYNTETSKETEKKSQTFGTYASTTKYIVQPTKAFRIPKEEMQLEYDAKLKAKNVIDLASARRFLEEYGSHVSAGIHTLGGVYFSTVQVTTKEEIEESALLDAAGKQFGTEVSGGYSGIGWSVSAAVKVENFNISSSNDATAKKTKEGRFEKTVKTLGPATTDPNTFGNVLQCNNATWFVIDRGDRRSLIPVWEILRELGDEYEKPATLIKRSWEMKQYSRLAVGQEQRLTNQPCGDKDETIETELTEMKAYICKRTLVVDLEPDMCVETLINIFRRIRKVEQICKTLSVNKNVMVVALQVSSFMKFLKNVANKQQKTFGTAHKIIREVIDPVKLRGKIDMDQDLKNLLERNPSPPEKGDIEVMKIDTENLVEELRKLGEKVEYDGMDSETGNRKAASLLQSALRKETDEELKSALNELAIKMGYQEDNCDFLTPLGSSDLSILANTISKTLQANFEPGAKVKYTFRCEKEELGSGQVEAVGTVKLVRKRNAYVLWESLTNNTTGKTWMRQNETEEWNCNWLGEILVTDPIEFCNPTKNEQLPCRIPFWDLQTYNEQYSADDSFLYSGGLKWHAKSKVTIPPTFTVGSFCVDKKLPLAEPSSPEDIAYLLCRRMDAFKDKSGPDSWEDDEFSWSHDEEEKSWEKSERNPFYLLLKLLTKCTLSAKMRLFDMMLQQRYTVPLITQNSSGMFFYNVDALRFVNIKLFSHSVELLKDTSLPRISFVSRRPEIQTENAYLIKEVLSCNIASSVSDGTHGTIAELGVGFLKDDSKSGNCDPWLTLYVRGDYKLLWKYVNQFSDFVVVELKPDDTLSIEAEKHCSVEKTVKIIKWKIRHDLPRPRKCTKPQLLIEGSFHGVSSLLKHGIRHYIETMNIKQEDRSPLPNLTLERRQLENEITGWSDVEKRMGREKFDELRQQLQMQNSFAKQCDLQSEMKRIRANVVQRENKCEQVRQEEMYRLNIADQQIKLPLIQQFVGLLSEPDRDLRVIGVQQFGKHINERCNEVLRKEKVTKDRAWTYYKENPKDSDALQRYYRAKKEYTNKSIGLTHCWRELSHIYSAKPGMYPKLPLLAAQYLIDGFSLEIMDGDAGSVNIEWFEKVMFELDSRLTKTLGREPKVFVVSIMGTQSTGKSTLLNTMFGCQLQTSAGQCTRGVHLQLAKAENREGIDYVLIMDTEGIRSPEYFGTEGSVSRDNRMATFAVLPAHACIITTVNEEDSAIKEVLPIVMLAFKGSNIAQESAGRLSSLLFFVYSKVGTSPSDLEGFEENRRQLVMELQNAADKIAGSKVAGNDTTHKTTESGGTNLKKVLSNFRTNNNEAESDVKYLGLLNKGEKPPDDIPNFEYGEKVYLLLEYIHKRMKECSFKGQTLKEWVEYLELVIKCINTSDFELHFKTALQFQSYNDLQDKLYDIREILSIRYSEAYNVIEHQLLTAKEEPKIDDLIDKLRRDVSASDQEQTSVVKKLLQRKEFQQFRTEELKQWYYFKSERQRTWEQLLRDAHETKWKFSEQEKELESKIWNELKRVWKTSGQNLNDERRQCELFSEIFNKHLKKEKEDHPPLNTVKKITEEYSLIWKKFGVQSATGWLSKAKEFLADKPDKLMKFLGFKEKSDLEKIARDLKSQVAKALRTAKCYNAQYVQDAIKYTNDAIDQYSISNKDERKRLHQVVFTLLNEKLERIQKKWDNDNNVAVKLENSEERLLQNFKNMCKGFVGAKSVAAEISGALKQAYRSGYKHHLAYDTFQRVKVKKWVKSADTMQAHIDLDLIEMIKAEKITDLLNSIYKSREHYQNILTKLIVQCSRKTVMADEVIEGIKRAVKTASTYIEMYQNNFAHSFREQLDDHLPQELLKVFPTGIWESVTKQEKNDGLRNRDWKDIGVEIQKSVELWKQEMSPHVSDRDLCELVTSIMERERGSTSTRERCSEPCPRCKMLCFHSSGHENEFCDQARLHDAHHQPKGICGVPWAKTDELVDTSCTESVENNDNFRIGGGDWIPYKDFCKKYPSWALPNSKKKQKLREYIFANYQDELVKRFSGTRRCPESKLLRFKHNLDSIKSEREKALE